MESIILPASLDPRIVDYLRRNIGVERVMRIVQTLKTGRIPIVVPVPQNRIYIQMLPSPKSQGKIGYILILYGNQLSEFYEWSSSGLMYFESAYRRAVARYPSSKIFIISELLSIKDVLRIIPKSIQEDFVNRSTNIINWLDLSAIVPFEITPHNLYQSLGGEAIPSDIELFEWLCEPDWRNAVSIIRRLFVKKTRIYDRLLNQLIEC